MMTNDKNLFDAQTNKMKSFSDDVTIKRAAIDAKGKGMPRLVVGGKSKPLGNKIFGIGRSKTNQIIVADPKVSKYHAIVFLENGKFYIKDTDSTNGTLVNSKSIPAGVKVQLNSGDKIKVGQTTITFSI